MRLISAIKKFNCEFQSAVDKFNVIVTCRFDCILHDTVHWMSPSSSAFELHFDNKFSTPFSSIGMSNVMQCATIESGSISERKIRYKVWHRPIKLFNRWVTLNWNQSVLVLSRVCDLWSCTALPFTLEYHSIRFPIFVTERIFNAYFDITGDTINTN